MNKMFVSYCLSISFSLCSMHQLYRIPFNEKFTPSTNAKKSKEKMNQVTVKSPDKKFSLHISELPDKEVGDLSGSPYFFKAKLEHSTGVTYKEKNFLAKKFIDGKFSPNSEHAVLSWLKDDQLCVLVYYMKDCLYGTSREFDAKKLQEQKLNIHDIHTVAISNGDLKNFEMPMIVIADEKTVLTYQLRENLHFLEDFKMLYTQSQNTEPQKKIIKKIQFTSSNKLQIIFNDPSYIEKELFKKEKGNVPLFIKGVYE